MTVMVWTAYPNGAARQRRMATWRRQTRDDVMWIIPLG
jgi:hypothetical protein